MNKIAFALTVLVLAIASCNRTDNYIIPVDYEKYYKDVTSLTEKEGQELGKKIMMDWYNNTMGREIPDITIKDLDGKTLKLKKWLKRETILVFSNSHCGFGKEEVEKEFPNAILNLKDELKDIDILCLIELAEDSTLEETLEYAKSLQDKYNNLFIIDQDDALRTNLTGSPTEFFIDKKQIVRHVHVGMAMEQGRRENEIRQGISLMKKEKQK
ncbi:MAG: redoxin family protein [Bacteroidales bacterium]|nr:redoxin family protein [Bacteroidales bacterium]